MSTDTEDKTSTDGDKGGDTDYLNMGDDAFMELGESELLPPGEVDTDDKSDEDTDDDTDEDKDKVVDKKEDKVDTDGAPDKDKVDDADKDSDTEKELTDEEIDALSDEDIAKMVKAQEDKDKADEDNKSDEDDEDKDKEDEDADTSDKEEDDKDKKEAGEKDGEIDYKARYEEMLSPLKANGKTMTIDTIDDMRKLAQMGANYNKKMAAMKPSMKILKMLEKADLHDEGKLNFLIDLHKQDPDAIKKLLRDSKIDTDTLSMDDEIKYEPTQHGVGDSEVELDAAIDAIKDTPTYSRTLKVVGSEWDDKSKQIVADQPDLIRVINDQIASGVYDKISNEVEKERVFGRLGGLSDIEAYRQIGEAMEKKGAFKQEEDAANESTDTTEADEAKAKKEADNEKRRAKRQALKGNKSLPQKKDAKKDKDYSPLALSDADYLKEFDASLL